MNNTVYSEVKFSLLVSACLKCNLRKGSRVDNFLSRVAFGMINVDDFSMAVAVISLTLLPDIKFQTAKTCRELIVCFSCGFFIVVARLNLRIYFISLMFPEKQSPSSENY